MKYLFDTNVLIPLEPGRYEDINIHTTEASDLLRLIRQHHHLVFVHPASLVDLQRDKNPERQKAVVTLLQKYPRLDDPPKVPRALETAIGKADPGSNDWADHSMLAAVSADAVDILITEDKGLIRKAVKAGLADRVYTIHDAIDFIHSLYPVGVLLHRAVRETKVYNLDTSDPIFDGLRRDYPDFDIWLSKCKKEHRSAWVIDGTHGELAGLCIQKEENHSYGLAGKILKLATFKVSDDYFGNKYGELLLKTAFQFAVENSYSWTYFTVFPKHEELIALASDFGFNRLSETTKLGEQVLAKPFTHTPTDYDNLDSLAFNIRFGPKAIKVDGASVFLVPIRPKYHEQLFPEFEKQLVLLPGTHASYGNTIKKAYLSNAITRQIERGDILIFYRSHELKSITAIGVVEEAFVSNDPSTVAKKVGNRTVYSYSEIEQLCRKEVLGILFRFSQLLPAPIADQALLSNNVLNGPPQSVVRLKDEGVKWLRQVLRI